MSKYFLYFWGWFEFRTPWDMKTLCIYAEFLYYWDLYYIVLTNCAWKCLHASVHGSQIVKFAYIERENICIHVYPHLIFLKFVLYFFIFPYLLNFHQSCFFQNLFCFSYFYWGRKLFLKPILFIGGVFALQRGNCLYFL